jgi:hypothetical protein
MTMQNAQQLSDRDAAERHGISLAHAALLRLSGGDQDVLHAPEKFIGPQTKRLLAFWRRLDAMSKDDWLKVIAARDAVGVAARTAAGPAVWAATWNAEGDAARAAAWDAGGAATWNVAGTAGGDVTWGAGGDAGGASNEIQGSATLKDRGQAFFFLPMFGISDPAELDVEPEAA